MELSEAPRDVHEKLVQADAGVLSDRVMELSKSIVGLLEVFGNGVLNSEAAFGDMPSIQDEEALLFLVVEEPPECLDHILGAIVVKTRGPKLGGRIRREVEFGPRKKRSPCSAGDLAKVFGKYFDEVDGSLAGFLVGPIGGNEDFEKFNEKAGAKKSPGELFD